MSSPTPVRQALTSRIGQHEQPRRRLQTALSGGVPAGIRAWRRKAKSTSSSASSGKGLGMGMAGTPAKSTRSASSIGWQSTPPNKIRPRPRSSSDEEHASLPSVDFDPDTFDISTASLFHSVIDKISPIPQKSSSEERDSFGGESEPAQLFPELQDFLVPLNDLSDEMTRGQDDAADIGDETSIELGRAGDQPFIEAYSPDPWDRHDDEPMSPDSQRTEGPLPMLLDADRPTSYFTPLDQPSSGAPDDAQPWLLSPPHQLDSPTPSIASLVRCTPPVFSPSPAPGPPESPFKSLALSPAPVFSRQITIRPGMRRKHPIWRGARIYKKKWHGSNDCIEDDYDKSGSMSEDSREDRTAYPCKRPRRSSVKIDEEPERTLAYEVARKRRIAHYIDLELNYHFTEEWVLW